MAKSDGGNESDNQSIASTEEPDKTIIGYNYDSNDVKIIKYKDIKKGTIETDSS